MKSVRADLLIATLALLISAGTALSSVYQTHVIANQLSSSVWPYLSLTSDTTTARSWRLSVTDDGLGPALIGSASLELDGRRFRRFRDAFAALRPEGLKRRSIDSTTSGSIGPTTVVRAGETKTVIAIDGPVVAHLGDLGTRVSLALCYCSLLDQCWTVRSREERHAVAACAEHETLDY